MDVGYLNINQFGYNVFQTKLKTINNDSVNLTNADTKQYVGQLYIKLGMSINEHVVLRKIANTNKYKQPSRIKTFLQPSNYFESY